MKYIGETLGKNHTLYHTKLSTKKTMYDLDKKAPLYDPVLLDVTLPYDEIPISAYDLAKMCTYDFNVDSDKNNYTIYDADRTQEVEKDEEAQLLYYFGSLPPVLKKDIEPLSQLFLTAQDEEESKVFYWLSSTHVNMHTHFDMVSGSCFFDDVHAV